MLKLLQLKIFSEVIMPFLPINREDMKKSGWNEVDFVFVTGDAYVDHPTFGAAIL